MKRHVLMSALLVSVFACPAVFSEEFEAEDVEFEMELHEREIEQRHREAQMDIEREMQQIELRHREAEMDAERQMRTLELEQQELELEQRRVELERAREAHKQKKDPHPLLLLCVVVNILVAVWVYKDIRRLNRGSGIWIALALLTGLLGGLVYAIVRLGDGREKQS